MSAESFMCRCLLGHADLPWSAVPGGGEAKPNAPWTVGPLAEDGHDNPYLPERGHWNTDSGYGGYGMSEKRAVMVAQVLNMVPDLLRQIEDLETQIHMLTGKKP